MDEHLPDVDDGIEKSERRPERRTGSDVVDEIFERSACDTGLNLVGVPGEERQENAGSGIESAFPDHEMRCEVARGPITTQSGGALTDLGQRMYELATFVLCEAHTHSQYVPRQSRTGG